MEGSGGFKNINQKLNEKENKVKIVNKCLKEVDKIWDPIKYIIKELH